MRKPEISIIVPNYNYSAYLTDALESIAHQTYKNWECIIIDDGSTDNSIEIIQKYTRRDGRFKLIKNEHHGISVARNAGLDAARGNYIAFLDADDCFTEYALEMLLYLAYMTGADMVGGATNIVAPTFKYIPNQHASWSSDSFTTTTSPLEQLLAPLSHKWAWIWRRIYRRELIGDLRFVPELTTAGEDMTFMLNICYRANMVAETDKNCVMHRIHPYSIMSPLKHKAERFNWFPWYFKHIRDDLLDKYDSGFLRHYYRQSFGYMLRETVFTPKKNKCLQSEGKKALLDSIKVIPLKYLSLKQRILCRFLLWTNK